MILAQYFSPEEDFYAIPPVDVYANNLSDSVNWQALLPGKQIIKVTTAFDLVKWQQQGFKIKIEKDICKFFGVEATTEEEELVTVKVCKMIENVEFPHVLEIELQEEDNKVTFVVDGVKNSPVELLNKEVIFCKSKNFEFELEIKDVLNLPKKFLVELKPYLAHETQGILLV